MVLISVTHCANNCHLCTSDIKYNKIPCMFSTEFCNLKNYWAVPVADAYHKHGRPTWKVWTDDALNLWSSKDPQDFLHKSSSYWSILLDTIPLVQQPEAPTSILIQHQHRERRSYIATLWTMSYSALMLHVHYLSCCWEHLDLRIHLSKSLFELLDVQFFQLLGVAIRVLE